MAITRRKRPDTFSLNGSAQIGYGGGDEYFEVIEFFTELFDGQSASVSSCNFTAGFRAAEGIEYPSSLTVHCLAHGYGWDGGERWSSEQTFTWRPMEQTQHTFQFSNVGTQAVRDISFELYANDGIFAYSGIISNAVAGYTFTPPTLGLSVSPSSLYVGERMNCYISEPFGQTFDVFFSYNSTTLQNFSTSSNSFAQTANESWFSTAGVTGSSMQVTVSISDGLGRTASARVTVNKHTALVPTISAPKGGNFDGGQSITFAWTSAGDGTQTKAELQWSKDNVNWSALTTVSGSGTQWTAPAGKFSAGTVYWRLRLTSNHGITSGWVLQSFTVTISAPVVTLTSPTSGSRNGAAQIPFVWTIAKGSGSVNGTQMEYSNDDGISWTNLINSTGSVTSYNAAAGTFKAGATIWRVRAKDSLAGWGAWKQATITITYAAAVVTLTTPTSGSHDGGQAITFVWEVTKGGGSVTQAQFRYSSDGGASWTYVPIGADTTTITTAAGKFSAGQLIWSVRARDQYAGWGAWKQATITITYAAPVVTLTAPTSGSKDGGKQIAFNWTIAAGSGSVTGTQMEYSTDSGVNWTSPVNSTGKVTSYTAAAGKFPGGAFRWRVRARDTYAGWGDWKTANITISYTPATVTLTTPTSGSWDSAEQITFGWSVTAGSGSVTGTQMQISTDDGLTWSDLINSSRQVTTYTSAVAQFPAGALKWRVRAKDSYSGYADNWKQASITVTYSAVSQVMAVNSPTSGVYNAAAARTFTVRLDASGPVHTPFQIQAASFFWRSGETGEFTELDMTPGGNTAAVEIPAGTFPSGRIEWYASATDTSERTTETPHYVLTALQTAVEAAPLSPINTIESGSGPIVFRWTYGSLDGAPQGRAQLQYSRDGETWTDEHIFADITGEQTTYIAEQGTFPGGTVFWRVRSYNDAGTAGPWSAAVSFSSYSAPLVTGVTGDGKPFATITWQADGQEAYEIEVGGKTYGPYYGADVRSFTLPEPLPDGSYTIRVRAQNKMTLWSQWIEGQMSVVNVPSGDPFDFVIDALPGNVYRLMITDESVDVAPTITGQPKDRQGNEESVNETQTGTVQFGFKTDPQNSGNINIQWYAIANWSTDKTWREMSGKTGYGLAIQAVERLSGNLYRARLWNDTGEIYTRAATFTYGRPDGLDYLTNTIPGIWHADTGFFLVYRDEKLIAKTYSKIFDDRVITGKHTYRIVQSLPGGYYRESLINQAEENSVTCPAIAPLEGGDFLSLKLSENSDREVRITEAREVEWTQYAGADYPSAEIGEGKSKAVALDVSALMSDEDFAKAFSALLGKDVIVKTPDGSVVIGPLESLDLRAPRSHRSWTFGVTQMEWSDYVDES